MQIEIGKPYKGKDGEVVLVLSNIKHDIEYTATKFKTVFCVGFLKKPNQKIQFMEQEDFLERYTYITPIYEYRYCFLNEHSYDISSRYFTDNEVKPAHWINFQRLDFTKRERIVHSM